jgi:hypothetical protein
MSKRLQVILDDAELRDIQRLARQERMTVAEWVRRALRAARRATPRRDAGRQLEAVRAAARTMLADIERGYTTERGR